MSTDYTETLKKIKETEEASSREVLEKRKSLEAELQALESESAASIAEAKRQAEAHIADEVENARKSAQKSADALATKTAKEANAVAAKRLDKKELKKIIDNKLFSEFE